jgi:hypothetical protein
MYTCWVDEALSLTTVSADAELKIGGFAPSSNARTRTG